jgi:hypothetical protein
MKAEGFILTFRFFVFEGRQQISQNTASKSYNALPKAHFSVKSK